MHRTSASVADLPRATDAYLGAGADDLHMAGGRSSPFAGPPTMLYRPSQTAGGGQRRSVPEQFIVDEEGMRDEIRALARRMEAVEHEKAELRGRIARAERELQRRDRQIEDLLEARTPTGAQEGGPRQSGGTAPLRVETSLARSLRDRVRLLEAAVGDKEAEIFRVKNSAEYRAAAEGERLRTRQRGAAEALADLQERALHLRAVNERLREQNARMAAEAERWRREAGHAEGALGALERELAALPAGERRSLAEAGEELQRLREALRARQREAAAAEAAAQQSQRDRAARLAGLEERLAARGAAVARLQEERDRLERLLRLEEGAVGRHAAEAARGQRAVDGLQRRISELSG